MNEMQKLFGVSVVLASAMVAYVVATRDVPIAMDLPMPAEVSGDPLLDMAIAEVVMPVLDIVVPRAGARTARVVPCTRTVQELGTWADMHTGANINRGSAGTVSVITGGCPGIQH